MATVLSLWAGPDGDTQADDIELRATMKMLTAHRVLRTREVADPNSEPNRRMQDALFRLTLAQPGQVPEDPIAPSRSPDGLAGSLEGDFSVDNKGFGTYRVELPIPRSRSTPVPRLTFSYSSNVGTGVMGTGFYYTTGFYGAITRGRSILARDEVARGIELGDRDKFYLDGKRLLCMTGPATYGRPGSWYRTEVDSHVMIEALGTSDSIETFVVHDEDGWAHTFGKIGEEADGLHRGFDEQTGALDTTVSEYALKRVEDRLGNYATLSYEHMGFGDWQLSEIAYTGGTRVPPQFVIRFIHQPDHAPATGYIARRRFDRRTFLAAIRIQTAADHVLVAEYAPRYAPTADDGIRRVEAVEGSFSPDVGEPLDRLPATRFQWGTAPRTGVSWRAFSIPAEQASDAGEEVQLLGDFDHDGRIDLLSFGADATVRLSTKEGFGAAGKVWLDALKINREMGSSTSRAVQIADFDCDGAADLLITDENGRLTCWRSTGTSFALMASMDASVWLQSGAGAPGARRESVSGMGDTLLRIASSDLNGDGRSDVVVHSGDGRMHPLILNGQTLVAMPRHDAANHERPLAPNTDSSPRILGAVSEDLNHDGNDDRLWLETPEQASGSDRGDSSSPSSPIVLRYSIALPEGGFGDAVDVHEWHGETAFYLADFNNDSLPDFLIGERDTSDAGPWTWHVLLNRGHPAGAQGTASRFFKRVGPVLEELPPSRGVALSSLRALGPDSRRIRIPRDVSIEPDFPLVCLDVNGDRLDDVVWRDPSSTPGRPANGEHGATGWQVCLALGDGTFAKASPLLGVAWAQRFLHAVEDGAHLRVVHKHDLNGDGLAEWITVGRRGDGREKILGAVSGAGDTKLRFPRSDLVTGVVNGLGKTLNIAYLAAKDDRVYVSGAPVAYPILELLSGTPVVSDIWHDNGGNGYSQFSYHYAGNHHDMSGRGAMGFIAFTTRDKGTDFCKYQFLAHSFPMTGMTVRDQTIRAWRSGSRVYMEMIKSTDSTVVFDAVLDSFANRLTGTVMPFASRVVKSEWPDDGKASFTYTLGAPADAKPLFTESFPIEPTWVGTEDHWFDLQDPSKAVQLEFPDVRVPTILDRNWLPEDFNPLPVEAFPGKITFGNEVAVISNHKFGFYSRERKTYLPPADAKDTLTGRVHTEFTTKYLSKKEGVVHSPMLVSRYFARTDLISSVEQRERDEDGDKTGRINETTHERDGLGRLIARSTRERENEDAEWKPATTEYAASEFDDRTDLPAKIIDTEEGEKSLSYNSLFRSTSWVHFDNGVQARVVKDGLGRTVAVNYVTSGRSNLTDYQWTSAEARDWRRSQVVPAPRVGLGVTGRSVYAIRKTRSGQNIETEYRDRLDRVIRTVIESSNGETTRSDTVFDELDRVVCQSEAYTPGGEVTWKLKSYDAYGNVRGESTITSTAPKHPAPARQKTGGRSPPVN